MPLNWTIQLQTGTRRCRHYLAPPTRYVTVLVTSSIWNAIRMCSTVWMLWKWIWTQVYCCLWDNAHTCIKKFIKWATLAQLTLCNLWQKHANAEKLHCKRATNTTKQYSAVNAHVELCTELCCGVNEPYLWCKFNKPIHVYTCEICRYVQPWRHLFPTIFVCL